jgi:hypothetical protein
VDLAAVMDEVAEALRGIDGLRVHAWPADTVDPPAGVVSYPESYEYDATMRRGKDRMTLPIVITVGKANTRTARDRLAAYADGAGPRSVKAVIEGHTYTACGPPRVTGAEFGLVTIGGVEMLGATFSADIAGPGAPQ